MLHVGDIVQFSMQHWPMRKKKKYIYILACEYKDYKNDVQIFVLPHRPLSVLLLCFCFNVENVGDKQIFDKGVYFCRVFFLPPFLNYLFCTTIHTQIRTLEQKLKLISL